MLVMVDLDNTLVDRQSAVECWAQEFSECHRLPAGTAAWLVEQDRDGYADRLTVFEHIQTKFGLSDSVDEVLTDYRQRVVELVALVPGSSDFLQAIRSAGHSLVILSNGSSGQQHAKIDTLGLRSAVDAVVVSDDVGIAKPDSRIFELAAASVGATLTGAWMVGDSPTHDIVGASEIGLRTAWLRRGKTWPVELVAPTVSVDSLSAVTKHILSS